MADIRLVAVDMDGTFMRDDHSYDVERFGRVFARMSERGMRFACASGNQYWLMRSKFPVVHRQMGFVADNGAVVYAGEELISCSTMSHEVALMALEAITHLKSDVIHCVADGIESSWVPVGQPQEFFDFMSNFDLRIRWTDDVFAVDDR